MSVPQHYSPFAPSEDQRPPKLETKVDTPRDLPKQTVTLPKADRNVSLAEQIAAELKQELDGIEKASFARECGFTPNTLARAMGGLGLRLDTLEKIASVAGWSVELKDKDGETFARY